MSTESTSTVHLEDGSRQQPRPWTLDELERVDGIEAVHRLVERWGARRVMSWTRFVAARLGQEV